MNAERTFPYLVSCTHLHHWRKLFLQIILQQAFHALVAEERMLEANEANDTCYAWSTTPLTITTLVSHWQAFPGQNIAKRIDRPRSHHLFTSILHQDDKARQATETEIAIIVTACFITDKRQKQLQDSFLDQYFEVFFDTVGWTHEVIQSTDTLDLHRFIGKRNYSLEYVIENSLSVRHRARTMCKCRERAVPRRVPLGNRTVVRIGITPHEGNLCEENFLTVWLSSQGSVCSVSTKIAEV